MSTINKSKDLVSKVEEKVEQGLEVVKDTFDNLVKHLPFVNLAQHSDDTFNIELDLPGVKKEDIEIKVDGNYLIVNAVRKHKKEVKEDDYYLLESKYGMFSRSFALDDSIDRDKIDARYKDGRLYLTLEKTEAKKAKNITVK